MTSTTGRPEQERNPLSKTRHPGRRTEGERNGQNPALHLPEPRYECAGDYCPKPGYSHRASELQYHDLTIVPGFFCGTCLPKPLIPETGTAPQPRTLERVLRENQTAGRERENQENPESRNRGKNTQPASTVEDILQAALDAHGPESFLRLLRETARNRGIGAGQQ